MAKLSSREKFFECFASTGVYNSVGVDRMQRNFEPMRQQMESWRAQQLSAAAELTIYRTFIDLPVASRFPQWRQLRIRWRRSISQFDFSGKHFSKCPFDASHGILNSRPLFSAVKTVGSSGYDLQGIANVVVHQSDGS